MSEKTLNDLAVELFKTFARFEYALKHSGFHKGEGSAEPNWFNFALSIESHLQNSQTLELREAIDFMLQHAPKKQVIRNGLLEWEINVPSTNSNADLILLYVRRVRNNLFHGGKFNGRWFDPERNENLLRRSLIILKACLDASPQVKQAYHG